MKHKSILQSAAVVAVASILVRLTSFLREMSLAATYGAGAFSDAFIVAFTLPGAVLMFASASISAVFIPVYNSVETYRRRFANNVLTVLALIGLVFAVVFAVFPQSLVFLFASQLDAEASALASQLLRIMIWSSVPAAVGGVLSAYLQTQKAFFIAAIMQAALNIYVFLFILLSGALAIPILMGYGVLVGQFVMLACFLTAAYRKGLTYRPVLDFKMPELKILLSMAAPVVFVMLVSQINLIVDRNFASALVSGTISSLSFAARTVNVITSLIGVSLATVLYPRMSEQAASGDFVKVRESITASVQKLVPLMLPAMVGVVILSDPIVRLLFERGAFLPEDSRRTAESLVMYAPLLIAMSINAVVTRAFFSLRDTKTPTVIYACSVLAGIVLRFLLIRPMAHMGLALSSSVVEVLTMVLLLVFLRRRLGPLGLWGMGIEWVKIAAAAAVMGTAVYAGYSTIPFDGAGTLVSAVYLAGLVLAGIGVYVVAHIAMRSVFIADCVAVLRGLLASRSGR